MLARFSRKLRLTLEMIRFEHSLFALPLAATAALQVGAGRPRSFTGPAEVSGGLSATPANHSQAGKPQSQQQKGARLRYRGFGYKSERVQVIDGRQSI